MVCQKWSNNNKTVSKLLFFVQVVLSIQALRILGDPGAVSPGADEMTRRKFPRTGENFSRTVSFVPRLTAPGSPRTDITISY